MPGLDKITAFEFECYRIAEAASRTVEAEYYKELSKDTKGTNGADKFGGNNNVDPSQSAFGSW